MKNSQKNHRRKPRHQVLRERMVSFMAALLLFQLLFPFQGNATSVVRADEQNSRHSEVSAPTADQDFYFCAKTQAQAIGQANLLRNSNSASVPCSVPCAPVFQFSKLNASSAYASLRLALSAYSVSRQMNRPLLI